MSSLYISCLKRSYRTSRTIAIRRRRAISSPITRQQHVFTATPQITYSYTRYTTNRILPRQSHHCFSSLSAVEDDTDITNDKVSDDATDGDTSADDAYNVDALLAEIAMEELKSINQKPTTDKCEGDTTPGNEVDAAPKLNLLDMMKSIPSESSSSSTSRLDNDITKQAGDIESKKPNLSELLKTDIFAQSWAESSNDNRGDDSYTRRRNDYSDYSRTRRRGDYYSDHSGERNFRRGNRNDYRSNDREKRSDYYKDDSSGNRRNEDSTRRSEASHNTSWSSPSDTFDNEVATRILSGDDTISSGINSHQSQSIVEPTPTEIEYNKLLDQTNELLSLSNKDSTVQLMDFDKVMTEWSRFHTVVDNSKSNENDYSSYGGVGYGSGGGVVESLKSKASDQCMKLLEALEYNYDCILHHHALPTGMQTGEDDLPQTRHTQLIPNAASYNLALHTLAHSGKSQVSQEAYTILTRMLDRCQKYLDLVDNNEDNKKLPLSPYEPTTITYNSVIHAIAKSGANDAGYLAEEVFGKMDEWKNQCNERNEENSLDNDSNSKHVRVYHGVTPNARTLACVIDAWSNTKTTNQQSFASERAETILNMCIKRRRAYVESVTGVKLGHDDNVDVEDDFSDDMDSVNFENGDVQEELIDDELIEEVSSLDGDLNEAVLVSSENSDVEIQAIPFLKPNTVAFNSCIHAWAASGRGQEGAHRAQELLAQLEALSQSGELDLPSGYADESLIDEGDASDADYSLKPNVRTYSMVMNAWANVARVERGSGEDAASHCEEILNRMEERGAIDSSVRPNLVAYVTSISCWARTYNVEYAASKAENILNRMIDLYYNEDVSELPQVEGDLENASHDAPFNSVITAYARSSDPYATERALAILERLEVSPISPTVVTYNAVLDVCAKHGEPERALEVLIKMKQTFIAPDSTSYDTILNSFARCEKDGTAERAYEFLCQLEEEQSSGESTFTPSVRSYAAIINAYARESGKDYGGMSSVTRAKEIYDKLLEQIEAGANMGEVDSYANTSLLNCCANINGSRSEKKEALVIAINAFEDMKKKPNLHGERNQYTFGTMMKVCNRLSVDDAEKYRLMEHLFKQACKRGCCSKAVLAQFLRSTPPNLNAKVILSLGGTKRDIPQSWHHAVPRRQWPTPPDTSRNDYN